MVTRQMGVQMPVSTGDHDEGDDSLSEDDRLVERDRDGAGKYQ